MIYLGIALLLTSAIASPVYNAYNNAVSSDDYMGYRLPGTQIPSNYKLNIVVGKDVIENKKNTFDGMVEITFKVKKVGDEKLDYIKLHTPSEKTSEVKLKNDKAAEVKIKAHEFNKTSSIMTINLESELDPKMTYVLSMSYTGNVDSKSMYGLYRSSFKNDKNETDYLLTTQFEPVYARWAFPCFDEPKFKATFDISITHPKGYSVLSNTLPVDDPKENGDDQLTTTFKTTPKISTYLIAFIVSHFTCTQGENIDTNVIHQVCSRGESSANRLLAANWGKLILNAFEDYTGVIYNQTGLLKMHQVAIPDFGAGAMENWGLVTYRERLVLYDEKESSDLDKQSIVSVIAHEFTHQWFGDLVTCNWWNDIFLNEGFAAYFQYIILTQVAEASPWQVEKQMIVDQLQPVLVDDAASSSKALTAIAATPDEVNAKFNTIAYNKGASIIRMMENIIGSDNFKKGVTKYLQNKQFSNAVPSDLLSAMEEQATKANLPEDTSLTKVMQNWLNVPGYPVVTVTQRGNGIILKQNRFLYDKINPSSKSIWMIPISYTVPSDEKKFDTAPKAWLSTSSIPIKNVFKNNSDWVIVNNKQGAFYRVQYANSLWKRIADQLMHDHTKIDVLNRAQIIDDLFNFARADNQMKYSQAFQHLNYLGNETEYFPWVSALHSLNFLLTRVGDHTTLGVSLKLKVVELIGGVYSTLSFEKDDSKLSLQRDLIFNAACKYGAEDCIKNVTTLFETYKTTGK
ncbi:unnamed protein product [Psylliodes chrysocephalus]|nr:unnamed protein product [Psylliodes chrysocephala]